jgi:N-acetylneuraminate synthase
MLQRAKLEPSEMKTLSIGDHTVGDGEPCFIIGEIGINHNGDLDVTKQLIDVAVSAGADAVKFQKRTIDVVYSAEELERPRENPFGETNGQLKHGLEFDQAGYEEIDRYCKEKGIMWFASCWDEASVDFIDAFDPPCYKVASASFTDADLIRYTAAKGRPMIISTGMGTEEQVARLVEILEEAAPGNYALMHTVSTYPAEIDELNLSTVMTLREKFNVPIGYSGHERGVVESVMSVVLGACMVERHITLDRAMWGSDQAASLEPKGFNLLIRDVRTWENACGDGAIRLCEREKPIIEKLRRKDTLFS